MRKKSAIFAIATATAAMTAATAVAQNYKYPFQNPELSFHERAKNLVSLLTLDEKINQVGMVRKRQVRRL